MINSDVLWHHAACRPDKAAIVWDGRTYTYAELAGRVRRLANALVGLGIGKGERVGLLATNCVEHAETVFALSEIGALWVPVNYRLTPSEVGVIVNGVECSAMVYSADMLETVEALRDEATSVRLWIGIGDGAAIGESYDGLLEKAGDGAPPRRAVPEDLFAIMHTSGTTGLPKGVMVTHRQMLQGFAYSVMEYGARADEVALHLLAQFHAGGNMYFMQQFVAGSTIYIHNQFDPDEVLRTIEKERISYAGLVPSMLIFLLESERIGKADLSSLGRIQYGASPIPVDRLARGLEVLDADFQGIYGQTEAAVFVTHLSGGEHRRAVAGGDVGLLESCGRTCIGYDVMIADGEDKALEPGEVGEVLIRGDSVMSGYWNRPDATEQTLRGGWLHSGDMGRMDTEGYIYIVDRKNDLIVSGGENVYPAEVENVISAHPEVMEVAVVGVPDERWVEAVKAIVAVRADADVAEADIVEFCRGKLGGFKIPKSVDFIEALPRTPTGKVKKNVLREPFWEGQGRRV
ncbi:MAG: long-chain-fatty-acid--CoA ligase [Rhodospirillales bacterium]|jgi:long-chain acyl-CoA synthetase|nr:long-chain-fatty-acid--CoA ligase [Rhodospirillales bacterium]MDP6786999.1 long-chain-fatty-acid--CoA ligase [Rhodospirillales bacterium]